MAKKRPQVALVYDFDGTLSPGNMQELSLIHIQMCIRDRLKDNPELLDELEAKVREALAAKEQK